MARKKIKGSWTRDDVRQLKKLFSNRPTADVAAALGRPTEAVIPILNGISVSRRNDLEVLGQ